MTAPTGPSAGPHSVTISHLDVAGLADVVGPERFAVLQAAADEARRALSGRLVLTINSTSAGGGVAEMLRRLVGYERCFGIDDRWSVIAGSPPFFNITKRVHHRLHGRPGDGGPLGADERSVYQSVIDSNAVGLVPLVQPGDIAYLHDPQVLGLAPHFAAAGARVVAQLHIGADRENELSDEGWEFLSPDLEAVDVFVFSRAAYAPRRLEGRQVAVIPPSIDPLSVKNQDLPNASAILRHVGIVAGGPFDGLPTFTRPDGSRGQVDRRPRMITEGVPPFDAPLVAQVSRWDPLKDMAGVMAGFALADLDAHLALVGPDPRGVDDDPESQSVLDDCIERWRALPDDVRARVHLVNLPMEDVEENAAMVNAVQRHATVVVQKSLAEGFGLTVTEAMWKGRPVVASAVGGIRDQITDGEDGVLVHDPSDPAELAAALASLLADPDRAARLGEAGRRRVHAHFLDDRHLRQRAELFTALARSSPISTTGGVVEIGGEAPFA